MAKGKKLIHYSRDGYNGNLTYNSVCGEIVKTHQENIDTSIHPQEATCFNCLTSKEYKEDLEAYSTKNSDIKRRIYIESDILKAAEFRGAQREVFCIAKEKGLKCVERVFSDVLDKAWHDLGKTWAAVKDADEIYATSSLLPLSNSYSGAPVIFNGMCERAIKENVTGKDVYILRHFSDISWYMIKVDLMKKAFKKNNLFMYNDDADIEKVDVSKIKK